MEAIVGDIFITYELLDSYYEKIAFDYEWELFLTDKPERLINFLSDGATYLPYLEPIRK